MFKIKVLQSVGDGHTAPDGWFKQFVEPMNRMYCDLYGYEYIVDDTSVRQDRHPCWGKAASVQRYFHDCDYLFLIDADACFYCHQISIHEEIIPLMEDKLICLPIDCGNENLRWAPHWTNTGTVLFKHDLKTVEIVNAWYDMTDIPEFEYTKWTWPVDQLGFQAYVYPKYVEYIQTIKDYYLMQSVSGWFVRHMWSAAVADRYEEFKKIYESPMMEKNRKLKK
jgi:hypothetical protein